MPPVLEKFGPPSPAQVEVTVEEKPLAPRLWFLNQIKTELIQVQADRFIHNWRKLEGIEPYPRFEPIRDKFRDEVFILEQFLKDEGMGAPIVNQCEVTYVNHIEPSGIWQRHGQFDKVFARWSPGAADQFLPEPEDGSLRLRFVIPGDAGVAANVEPAPAKLQKVLIRKRGSEVSVEVQPGGRLAQPFRQSLEAIATLLTLPPGWNSHSAKPIAPQNAIRAIVLVWDLLRAGFLAPIVVPRVRGGIQLEWHTETGDIEVYIDSPDQVTFFAEDAKTGAELIRFLESQGFRVVRVRGSHHILVKGELRISSRSRRPDSADRNAERRTSGCRDGTGGVCVPVEG